MIEKVASWYARKQIAAGLIQQEDMDVYKYGYILVMEMGMNIIISVALALMFDMLKCWIVFSCIFIPLRTFCGGWHASKSWICTLISNVTIVGIMIIVKYQMLPFNIWVMGIVEFICLVIIWQFAPIEHKNKPLSDQEKKVYGKVSKALYVLQLFLMVVFYCVDGLEILQTGMMAHIIVVISLLFGLFSNRMPERKSI